MKLQFRFPIKNSLSLWYDNGLVVDISLDSGIEIDRRILQTPDRIERVFHSGNPTSWTLAGGGFLISDGEQILESYLPRAIICSKNRNEEWEFTGWRFDGRLSDLGLEISSREELGVGLLQTRFLRTMERCANLRLLVLDSISTLTA